MRPASGGDGWLSLARRDLCGGCHTCWRGEGRWKSQNRKIMPLSLCRRTFKLKGYKKKFRTWTKKSSSVFHVSRFLCSVLYIYEHYMSISNMAVSGYGTYREEEQKCWCIKIWTVSFFSFYYPTTPKSAKSPSKQPLHKSSICPPKIIKDRLKNLSPIRPEQLKQKSQLPISQTAKIQMNIKVNKERPGSTFKMPSTTKSPIRTKQSNAQPSTKPLQRTYSIESMDCNTDCVIARLNLEEIIKNYNTWNHLTIGKPISSITFFKLLISYISYVSI